MSLLLLCNVPSTALHWAARSKDEQADQGVAELVRNWRKSG